MQKIATEERNILLIKGLAEGIEGKKPSVFMEDLLQSLLPSAQLSPYFTVERAHRVLPQAGPTGSPPRTMILQVFNFKDQDEILRASQAAGELKYHNGRLLLFQGYTMETQKLLSSFNGQGCHEGQRHQVQHPVPSQAACRGWGTI